MKSFYSLTCGFNSFKVLISDGWIRKSGAVFNLFLYYVVIQDPEENLA